MSFLKTQATSSSRWLVLLLALFVLPMAVGCASSGAGGGGGADVAAAAAPDYTNEMGENGLLTPRALHARFIDAIGGEDAIRAHKSATTKGKMELAAMGMTGDVMIVQAAPNKQVMNVEMGGMGSMSNGYNGEIGWSENPMTGPALLDGAALDMAARDANFYGVLMGDELYPEQETVEKTEFDGQAAHKVRLVDQNGHEVTQYFAEDSGLLIGITATQVSDMGEAEVTTKIGDYKDFGGQLIATSQSMSVMGMEIKTTVEEVTFDNVDPAAFEPPDAIKALLD